VKRVHIIGGKNHGKTTLVVELVRELCAQGLRVGTIKHTHHQHELDTPGKDSHRHHEAGSAVVGILSRSMNAAFWPPSEKDTEGESTNQRERNYETFAPMFRNCDLVLVEGDTRTNETKIEVWRATLGTPSLAETDASISAVVTDDPVEVVASVWRRSDVAVVAHHLMKSLAIGPNTA